MTDLERALQAGGKKINQGSETDLQKAIKAGGKPISALKETVTEPTPKWAGVADMAIGVPETAYGLLQGAVGGVAVPAIAGLAGLAKNITSGPDEATKTINQFKEALSPYFSYSPYSQSAKQSLGLVNDIIDLPRKGAAYLGGKAQEKLQPMIGVEPAATVGATIESLGEATPYALGGITPYLKQGAYKAGNSAVGKLDKVLNKTVKDGMSKGVRPSVGTAGQTFSQREAYFKKATSAVEDIVNNKANLEFIDDAGISIKNEIPKTLNQFTDAISQTKKIIFDKYDTLAKETGDKGINLELKSITQELSKIADSKEMRTFKPDVVDYVNKRIEGLSKAKTLTAQEAQNAIVLLNESLKSYYKNPSYDTYSKASIDAVIVNNLRKSLDSIIEENTGEPYQQLKNQYGNLKAIEKDVNRRTIVDARKNIKGLIDFTDILSSSAAVHGLMSLNPATLTSAATAYGIKSWYKWRNNPNTIIKDMFSKAENIVNKKTTILGKNGNKPEPPITSPISEKPEASPEKLAQAVDDEFTLKNKTLSKDQEIHDIANDAVGNKVLAAKGYLRNGDFDKAAATAQEAISNGKALKAADGELTERIVDKHLDILKKEGLTDVIELTKKQKTDKLSGLKQEKQPNIKTSTQKPFTILNLIRKIGGISLAKVSREGLLGEIRDIATNKEGAYNLINKNGRSLKEILEYAKADKYLPEDATLDDLLQAIKQGNVTSMIDEPILPDPFGLRKDKP